jgi:hypothetical protein
MALRVGSMGEGGRPAPRFVPGRGESDPHASVAEVLAWHEFGLVPGVPARPFVRQWTVARKAEIAAALRRIAHEASARGIDAAKELAESEGRRLAASLRAFLRAGILPPLAPSTLKRVAPRTQPLATPQILSSIRGHFGPADK